jgi:hypothetical protein
MAGGVTAEAVAVCNTEGIPVVVVGGVTAVAAAGVVTEGTTAEAVAGVCNAAGIPVVVVTGVVVSVVTGGGVNGVADTVPPMDCPNVGAVTTVSPADITELLVFAISAILDTSFHRF